jgi:hypothetical protein
MEEYQDQRPVFGRAVEVDLISGAKDCLVDPACFITQETVCDISNDNP